jgi:hypothetical protein
MYNIAICLSGEPRHYIESLQSIKNIIKTYSDINIHIFYHFWDNITECVWQQRRFEVVRNPIKKNLTSDFLKNEFNPTVGICESKDNLNTDIRIVFDYLQEIIKKYNVDKFPKYKSWKQTWQSFEDFTFKVKNTNIPTLSQIISFLKCQKLRIKYEIDNNINYNIIIRSRSDISFDLPKKIHQIITHRPIKAVQFKELKICTDSVLYSQPAFFIFSSNIVKNDIFDNYIHKVKELMFRVKAKDTKSLHVLTDHSIIPEYFTSQKCAIEAPCPNWGWTLKSSKIKP